MIKEHLNLVVFMLFVLIGVVFVNNVMFCQEFVCFNVFGQQLCICV
jgi:hypothetical protein